MSNTYGSKRADKAASKGSVEGFKSAVRHNSNKQFSKKVLDAIEDSIGGPGDKGKLSKHLYNPRARSVALKKKVEPQEKEDKLAAASLRRYMEKSRGVRMSRKFLG